MRAWLYVARANQHSFDIGAQAMEGMAQPGVVIRQPFGWGFTEKLTLGPPGPPPIGRYLVRHPWACRAAGPPQRERLPFPPRGERSWQQRWFRRVSAERRRLSAGTVRVARG